MKIPPSNNFKVELLERYSTDYWKKHSQCYKISIGKDSGGLHIIGPKDYGSYDRCGPSRFSFDGHREVFTTKDVKLHSNKGNYVLINSYRDRVVERLESYNNVKLSIQQRVQLKQKIRKKITAEEFFSVIDFDEVASDMTRYMKFGVSDSMLDRLLPIYQKHYINYEKNQNKYVKWEF